MKRKLTKEMRTNRNLRNARRAWKRNQREQHLRNLDLAARRKDQVDEMLKAYSNFMDQVIES